MRVSCLLVGIISIQQVAGQPACDLKDIAALLVQGKASSCAVDGDWSLGKVSQAFSV